jgi:hypothetical protein
MLTEDNIWRWVERTLRQLFGSPLLVRFAAVSPRATSISPSEQEVNRTVSGVHATVLESNDIAGPGNRCGEFARDLHDVGAHAVECIGT